MATIRDVTQMDDGRRITYYYSAPAPEQNADAPAVSETGEAKQQ